MFLFVSRKIFLHKNYFASVAVVECGCGYCGRVWLWLLWSSVVVVIVVECGCG